VQAITPSMMRKLHWVNPVFVCEIKFAEWTRDGKLRAPVFLGLRDDKKPKEVGREAEILDCTCRVISREYGEAMKVKVVVMPGAAVLEPRGNAVRDGRGLLV